MDYKKIIASKICKVVELENDFTEKLLEVPPKPDMGDFAFPCFKLSKTLRKAPQAIAEEIAEKIEKEGFERVEALGPYVNFFLDKGDYSKDIIETVLKENENYGGSEIGKGKNITIDYSSPNIAKPFHIGHLFTTVIGNSLYKMYKFKGYTPIGINHLGDWGTQFGKLISAYKRWVDEEALEKDPINELLRIYVKFHEEVEKNPELEDEGREYFRKLEEGDEEATALWKRFTELSLREFDRVYKMLNVSFDSYAGESFYSDKMDAVVQDIKDKNLLVESNGALVVDLEEYNMPPCIVIKSNGATIYATRDLAAANYRKETYNFEKSIYVVGKDQSLHFKQLFKVLELAGKEWAKDCHHVSFGLVRFADQKLSTRKGNVIFLEDLLNQAVEKTLNIINTKNPNLESKEEAAKKIGIGAVVFTYLKNSREKDIIFDWDEMLSFDGETGPYVQYTYARANSVIKKLGDISGSVDFRNLKTKEEFELVKAIAGFGDSILSALDRLEPSVMTRHIIEVAKLFNKFYNNCPVLSAEEEVKKARLALTKAAMIVIKNGLGLLGIDVVEKM